MKKKNVMASAFVLAMLITGCSGGSDSSSSQSPSHSESSSSQTSTSTSSQDSSKASESESASGTTQSISDSSQSEPVTVDDVVEAADLFFERLENNEIESLHGTVEASDRNDYYYQNFGFDKETRRGYNSVGESQKTYLLPHENDNLVIVNYGNSERYYCGTLTTVDSGMTSCYPFNYQDIYDLVKSFYISPSATAKLASYFVVSLSNDEDRVGPDCIRNVNVLRADTVVVEGSEYDTAIFSFATTFTQRHINNPYGSYYYQNESFRERFVEMEITVSARDGMVYGLSFATTGGDDYDEYPVSLIYTLHEGFDEEAYESYDFPEITREPEKDYLRLEVNYNGAKKDVYIYSVVGGYYDGSTLKNYLSNEYDFEGLNINGVYLDEALSEPFHTYETLDVQNIAVYLDATLKDDYSLVKKIDNYKEETYRMFATELTKEEEATLIEALPNNGYVTFETRKYGSKLYLYDGLSYDYERDQRVYVDDELVHAKSVVVEKNSYTVRNEGYYHHSEGCSYRPHFARDIREMAVSETSDSFYIKATPRYSSYLYFFILPREVINAKNFKFNYEVYYSDYVYTNGETIDESTLVEPDKSYYYTSEYGYYDDEGHYNKVRYDEVNSVDEKYDIYVGVGTSSSWQEDRNLTYKQFYFKIY